MKGKARSDLAVQTWDALKGAFWPIFLAIGEKTRDTGTTPAQISLLFVLFSSPQSLTPLAVAGVLGVTPGTVTGTLNSLEEMGLIERLRGEDTDRRVVHLRLTPKGRELMERWLASTRSIIEDRVAAISSREQRTLIELLAHIGPPIPGVPENLASILKAGSLAQRTGSKAGKGAPVGSRQAQ